MPVEFYQTNVEQQAEDLVQLQDDDQLLVERDSDRIGDCKLHFF